MNDAKQQNGSNTMVITEARWLTPNGEWRDGWVQIEDGKISKAEEGSPEGLPSGAWRLSAKGRMVAPGLIDIHIHGTDGHDCLGDVNEQAGVAAALPRHGVTSYVPAVVTGRGEDMERAVRAIAAARRVQAGGQAEILGCHLEGPYISPDYRGAHDPAAIRNPSIVELSLWLDASERSLRLVTIAPERPGALEAIRWLADHGVVSSVGHTAATYAEVQAAIEAGATHSVHCFNAMRPLHHREPGATGAVLSDDRLTAELIADFVHVHPAACAIALRSKGPHGMALVTDAIAAAGQPEGRYRLGTLEVVVRDGSARLPDGTLAGSVLTLDLAVRNLVGRGLLTPAEALRRASQNPARIVGVGDRKGTIEMGKDADLICLDDDLQVQWTMTRGALAYEREGEN